MRKLRFAVLLALAAVCVCGGHGGGRHGWPRGPGRAEAGPSRPVYYFHNVIRPTASGSYQIVSGLNGDMLRLCPAQVDTTGKCKDCQYVGGPKYSWSVMPDSTFTYNLLETAGSGADSSVTGYQNMAMFGPELTSPDSSVTASAIRPDPDGIFYPGVSFTWFPEDTLRYRHAAPDTAGKTSYFHGRQYADSIAGGDLEVGGDARIGGDVYLDGSIMLDADGSFVSADSAHADGVHGTTVTASDSLRVGSGGASHGAKIRGGLTVTGTASLATVNSSSNVSAAGGTVTAGDSDTAGLLAASDGSGNVVKYTASGLSADVTITVNGPIFKATILYNDTSTPYRQAFYYAGMTANHRANWNVVDQPPGTYIAPVGTTRINVGCKTDSLIVSSYGSSVGDVQLYFEAEIP